MREVEAIVWCPACKVDKFTVYRLEIRTGVYANRREPETTETKVCKDCGEVLTRHE